MRLQQRCPQHRRSIQRPPSQRQRGPTQYRYIQSSLQKSHVRNSPDDPDEITGETVDDPGVVNGVSSSPHQVLRCLPSFFQNDSLLLNLRSGRWVIAITSVHQAVHHTVRRTLSVVTVSRDMNQSCLHIAGRFWKLGTCNTYIMKPI